MATGSSGSLRFKISLSKQEIERDKSPNIASEKKPRTSHELYAILSEIHRQCVKRDHKGIFANPVTENIAPDYFAIISDPMDFGTMYARLQSRNHYATAGQYFSDLQLVCTNAMRYNPPDTIYFQKARKMLIFAEKQMTRQNLLKLSKNILREGRGLSAAELLDLDDQKEQQSRSIYWPTQTRHSQFFTPPQLREELNLSGNSSITTSVHLNISSSRKRRASSSSSISSSTGKAAHYSASPPSLVPEIDSPRKSTPTHENEEVINLEKDTPPWANSSSRFLNPEAKETGTTIDSDSVVSRLTLSPDSSKSNSPRNSRRSTSRRPPIKYSVSSPTFTQPVRKCASKSKNARDFLSRSGGGGSRTRVAGVGRRLFGAPESPLPDATPPPPQPERTYAEDVWTFSESLTDRTPPGEVLAQAKAAARLAKQTLHSRYGRGRHQRIAYLETSSPGKLTATLCPKASSFEETDISPDTRPINYPPAMAQLLTGRCRVEQSPSSSAANSTPSSSTTAAQQPLYRGLIEQMTSQQVATLHALSTLRYNPDEPIAMGIHGPLAIFEFGLTAISGIGNETLRLSGDRFCQQDLQPFAEPPSWPVAAALVLLVQGSGSTRSFACLLVFGKDDLAQMCDAYGGDPATMEYVLSLLSFVEPLGVEARRWAHRRLDEATAGYHAKMIAAFANSNEIKDHNWVKTARLTLDEEVIAELCPEEKADTIKEDDSKLKENEEEKACVEGGSMSENFATVAIQIGSNADTKTFETGDIGGCQMSMAHLPSETSTITAKQPSPSVQPLQTPESTLSQSTLQISQEEEAAESVVDDDDEDRFDILSAALTASGANNLESMAVGIPSNLAASASEMAQISALTAAISPIHPLATLPMRLPCALALSGSTPIGNNVFLSPHNPNPIQLTEVGKLNPGMFGEFGAAVVQQENSTEQSVLSELTQYEAAPTRMQHTQNSLGVIVKQAQPETGVERSDKANNEAIRISGVKCGPSICLEESTKQATAAKITGVDMEQLKLSNQRQNMETGDKRSDGASVGSLTSCPSGVVDEPMSIPEATTIEESEMLSNDNKGDPSSEHPESNGAEQCEASSFPNQLPSPAQESPSSLKPEEAKDLGNEFQPDNLEGKKTLLRIEVGNTGDSEGHSPSDSFFSESNSAPNALEETARVQVANMEYQAPSSPSNQPETEQTSTQVEESNCLGGDSQRDKSEVKKTHLRSPTSSIPFPRSAEDFPSASRTKSNQSTRESEAAQTRSPKREELTSSLSTSNQTTASDGIIETDASAARPVTTICRDESLITVQGHPCSNLVTSSITSNLEAVTTHEDEILAVASTKDGGGDVDNDFPINIYVNSNHEDPHSSLSHFASDHAGTNAVLSSASLNVKMFKSMQTIDDTPFCEILQSQPPYEKNVLPEDNPCIGGEIQDILNEASDETNIPAQTQRDKAPITPRPSLGDMDVDHSVEDFPVPVSIAVSFPEQPTTISNVNVPKNHLTPEPLQPNEEVTDGETFIECPHSSKSPPDTSQSILEPTDTGLKSANMGGKTVIEFSKLQEMESVQPISEPAKIERQTAKSSTESPPSSCQATDTLIDYQTCPITDSIDNVSDQTINVFFNHSRAASTGSYSPSRQTKEPQLEKMDGSSSESVSVCTYGLVDYGSSTNEDDEDL